MKDEFTMSLQRKTTIQCPKCQETIEVGMWQSLNAHMDPEAAKRLMKGEFFKNSPVDFAPLVMFLLLQVVFKALSTLVG